MDCGAKLPQGWEPRRCEGCLELCRCWAGMSNRRIAIGLCYVCGERPQTRHPSGRLSTRCERCLVPSRGAIRKRGPASEPLTGG